MKYLGNAEYRHGEPDTAGVLIANVGSPDAPTPAALRRYLAQFLSNPRIIELPPLLWRPILHGIILRLRPRRSAAAYRKVWQPEGSPLRAISERQAHALQGELQRRCAGRIRVALGMRYGNPSIAAGLEQLRLAGARRLLLLPLYPQYSAATTASVFDAAAAALRGWRWLPELRLALHYPDYPPLIDALAQSVRAYQQREGEPERLLFSFHGLPRHYFLAGDPYHCECHKTARLTAARLGLQEERWAVAFQSRFGPRAWLKPYTDHLLKQWAQDGVKNVQVICPGFSADCLETLEEVAIRYREEFLEAGGERLGYIPALNDETAHIRALADLVLEHARGWPEYIGHGAPGAQDAENRQQLLAQRQRALAAGARN